MSKIYNSTINITDVKQYNNGNESNDFQLNVLIQSKDLAELQELQRVIFEQIGCNKDRFNTLVSDAFSGNVALCRDNGSQGSGPK